MMSDFALCPVCKEYDFLEKHRCAPIFFFKHPDWGDEFQKVYAYTFEEAAEKFAKKFN